MEANGVQRTPLVARTQGRPFIHNQQQTVNEWNQPTAKPAPDYSRHNPHRQPFANFAGERSFMSTNASDRSGSAHEVEQLLINQQPARNSIPANGGWQYPNVAQNNRPVQRVFAPPTSNQRLSRGFRPAIPR
ncbi:hypothetical protein GALMADRAFT_235542 [Galerina marginata CBS 339.88]|uniref:Uncharacterized protein n=1 Tax=Galerina marginata (strain CBS 339.88) TaxID=685588 RepID=A0A067TJM7_GALM3|nr:hypothetical protein GALMADRAFT_235542 [Galerina marginata CBS 339.88]